MHLVLEAIPFVCLVKLPFDTTFPIQVRTNIQIKTPTVPVAILMLSGNKEINGNMENNDDHQLTWSPDIIVAGKHRAVSLPFLDSSLRSSACSAISAFVLRDSFSSSPNIRGATKRPSLRRDQLPGATDMGFFGTQLTDTHPQNELAVGLSMS